MARENAPCDALDALSIARRHVCRLLPLMLAVPGLILTACTDAPGGAWEPPPWWGGRRGTTGNQSDRRQ